MDSGFPITLRIDGALFFRYNLRDHVNLSVDSWRVARRLVLA